MISRIDGSCYIALIHSGIKNLERYRSVLNDLNVFPVPDGDTGTNMVMTLRCGYDAIKSETGTLSEISQRFSSSAVFGARGNSGVIVSQFFKGLSEAFRGMDSADPNALVMALQNGCRYAYASVSHPVEGTILTVVKDASVSVAKALPLESIDETVNIFLREAKASLARTPELLPILKKANVVDSGGSGIVYFFEGVNKYLNGEDILAADENNETAEISKIDLSKFNKDTSFKFGYCVEGLIQLKMDVSDFSHDSFKNNLANFGGSVVSSLESDKVKIHIHTLKLGPLMEFCQKYGEFLTVKVENMSVQNIQKTEAQKEKQKFLYDADREQTNYAIIAVASNPYMQQRFFDMGADVVILSDIAPSSQDFIDAFKLTKAKNILVFPNSANSILASMQAGSLYKKAKVNVLNCRSIAECYATLSIMDYDVTIDEAIELANNTLSSIYQFSIYQAIKDVKYGNQKISRNDFFALANNEILAVKDTLESITLHMVESALKKRDCAVITLFYGKYISPEYMEQISRKIADLGYDAEIAIVATFETIYDITVTLE